MRDFGVRFERVPLMCDNTIAISIAKKSSLPKKDETCLEETPLSERSCREGDIEMRYIDTERQLADIFTNPLDSS
jgi:hypothetical protein